MSFVSGSKPIGPSVITVWPCDCGGVRVEGSTVPFGHRCATCGAYPERYVKAGALTTDAAAKAAAEALRRKFPLNEFGDQEEADRADRDTMRYVLNGVRGWVNSGGPA